MISNKEHKLKKIHEKLDRYIHDIWKDNYFSSPKYSGHGGKIFKLFNPHSIDEFYDNHIKYVYENTDKPISERGLTREEMLSLATQLKNKSEKNVKDIPIFDVRDYANYIFYINYFQTFNGKIGELNLVDALNKKGLNARLSSAEEDSKYKVDVFFSKDNKEYGVQLKSHTFLLSNRPSVMKDIDELIMMYNKLKDENNIIMYYTFYDKNNNGYIFFEKDTSLTTFETLSKILAMNISERREFIKKFKRKKFAY